MNPLDIAFLVVMAIGIYTGMGRGFMFSVFQLAKILFGLALALRFSHMFSVIIERMFGLKMLVTPIVSFIIVLITVWALLHIVGLILDRFLRVTQLDLFKRAAGILFWVFLLAVGFGTVVYMGEKGGLITDRLTASSKVYDFVSPLAEIVYCKLAYIIPAIGQILESIELMFKYIAEVTLGNCY